MNDSSHIGHLILLSSSNFLTLLERDRVTVIDRLQDVLGRIFLLLELKGGELALTS